MKIQNVGVIGGGLMGRQIALNAAIYGYNVKVTDNSPMWSRAVWAANPARASTITNNPT